MKNLLTIFIACFIVSCKAQAPIDEVNMRMGNDIAGNTVIGPRLPFGSSHPSPDTKNGGGDGYSFGQPVYGFSQMHLSGGGGNSHYGLFLISPQIGVAVVRDKHLSLVSNEVPTPYKYSAFLEKYKIQSAVVPTMHGAQYTFEFPQTDSASIVLDCGFSIPQSVMRDQSFGADSGSLTFDSDSTIVGSGIYSGGWLFAPYKVYFAMSISKKPSYKGVFADSVKFAGQTAVKTQKPGSSFGAWLGFRAKKNEAVIVSIAVSLKSIENAKKYLADELTGKTSVELEKTAMQAWEKQLSKINIKGGSAENRSVFYSCLMRTMITPANRTGDSPLWNDNTPYWDDQYCVWDTWRTSFPLMLLLNPDDYKTNIASFIKRQEVNHRVDDAFAAGIESMTVDVNFRQGGDDVTNIIVDGYVKGVEGINWNKAYEIVKSQADSMRWPSYRDNGIIYFGQFRNPASTQMEFCYNDYLASVMAKGLGNKADAEKYAQRAGNWEKLWNPDIEDEGFKGFIQNQDAQGNWVFYPPKTKDLNGPHFYEGSSWVYSYFVPHNHRRLIELCGGPDKYVQRLEHAFKNNLIDYSNEPSFLTIRTFIDAGRPDLCSFWVHHNLKNYSLKTYPGDEDSGAMSSWYVFSALGFFPNAGTDLYYLNAPLFPYAEVNLPNGKKLVIKAEDAGGESIYIKSAKLNGVPLNKAIINHSQLIKGGKLEFVLSPIPTNWGK